MTEQAADLSHHDPGPPAATAERGVTLAQRAYRDLSRMIQERRLAGGQAVVEAQVAAQLGVSRTPLRQALQRLEGEGLLRKDANRSFVVRTVELREYLHSLRVRELLEGEAAALAAGRVGPEAIEAARLTLRDVEGRQPYDMLAHWRSDDEVHGLFIEVCGNPVMRDLIRSLRVTTKLFEIERLSERLEPDSRQHEEILDALAARDPERSRTAVATHLQSLFQFAIRVI